LVDINDLTDEELAKYKIIEMQPEIGEISKQATQVTEGSARYVEIENELVDINDLTDEELVKFNIKVIENQIEKDKTRISTL
ncbi:hypothetical protein, partial [Bacillus solimangrovi]|uniref:hypothetical protein n=1 Tax=Bacillus solimangrovi TaxID=1305675 RepID=UPI0015869EA6